MGDQHGWPLWGEAEAPGCPKPQGTPVVGLQMPISLSLLTSPYLNIFNRVYSGLFPSTWSLL